MSYVPHGSYYGGYDDFEDDGGFDFGDSYDSQTCREKFEPTLSAVINPSRSSEQTGNVQSREEDDGEEHANSRNFDNSGTDIAKVQGVKVEVQPEDGVPAPGSEAFFVGSDSPESSPRHTTGVLKSGTAAQGSPGSHKKSRFSPNLSPSYSKSKTSRQSRQRYLVADCQGELRSKYKKGSGSTDESSHDPHEQSRMLEKGEELKVAISRGNVERVMEILDGGRYLYKNTRTHTHARAHTHTYASHTHHTHTHICITHTPHTHTTHTHTHTHTTHTYTTYTLRV